MFAPMIRGKLWVRLVWIAVTRGVRALRAATSLLVISLGLALALGLGLAQPMADLRADLGLRRRSRRSPGAGRP